MIHRETGCNKILRKMKHHDYYIHVAMAEAKKSPHIHKHGAVLINNTGTIVSRGHNRYVTEMCHRHFVHAEVDAIFSYPKRNIRGFRLYVVRIRNYDNDVLANSKPCECCRRVCIKRELCVYYSS